MHKWPTLASSKKGFLSCSTTFSTKTPMQQLMQSRLTTNESSDLEKTTSSKAATYLQERMRAQLARTLAGEDAVEVPHMHLPFQRELRGLLGTKRHLLNSWLWRIVRRRWFVVCLGCPPPASITYERDRGFIPLQTTLTA